MAPWSHLYRREHSRQRIVRHIVARLAAMEPDQDGREDLTAGMVLIRYITRPQWSPTMMGREDTIG